MALKRIVAKDTGSIPAGGFVDIDYAPEVNLRLKRIIAVELTGGVLAPLFATFYLGDVPYFFPNVSLKIFDPANPEPIIFDLVHSAGVKITMRITNNDSTTRRVLLHLVYEE
ncbi:MAG: hypothetical protein LM564_00260 [Desulfurococcaceae archaeon]|nr:hypothetical protein [Desulfurococcaceae archaeon]